MHAEEWLAWVDALCFIAEGVPPGEDWDFVEFAAEWRRELFEHRNDCLVGF
jgi:hypothetical protein